MKDMKPDVRILHEKIREQRNAGIQNLVPHMGLNAGVDYDRETDLFGSIKETVHDEVLKGPGFGI